jgi:AraC-like DNA-binding protein
MENRSERMAELLTLVERHTPRDGICTTGIDNLFTFRVSEPTQRIPQVYEPGIIIGLQGKKHVYLEGRRYDYCAGNFLALFLPMSVECETLEASPEKPLLAARIVIDRNRIANLLLKMDTAEPSPKKLDTINASGIFSGAIRDNLLDALIRLFRTLKSPGEAAILGEAIIDEIYFRILIEEQGGALKYLLQQHGQIQQIAKAVEYVYRNLDKPISVENMADIVNMSSSGFQKKFKEVMHSSPLQYAKSIKLNRAQAYILEGKSVSEAGYMVGYNSPAQFSREYKRHFGVAPSAT